MPTPILIDCDPGIDDTLALIYLAGLHTTGEIQLAGVTTTAGNIDVATTARNAAWVLAQCGITEVPVAAGQTVPLEVPLTVTPETHGAAGLGYVTAPTQSLIDDWPTLWTHAIDEHGPDLHLIVTGPMTNLAQFRLTHPDHYARIGHITVMGGAVNYRGNTTPTAEWNFWVDPHAARDVFADAPGLITLCSLEVTEQMLLSPECLARAVGDLAGIPIAEHLDDIVRFYFEFHEANGEGYQAQIHDLLTCIIDLGRTEYRATETTIAVEADSELMRGTSVADLRNHWGRPANARLVTSADIDAAWEEFHRVLVALATIAPQR